MFSVSAGRLHLRNLESIPVLWLFLSELCAALGPPRACVVLLCVEQSVPLRSAVAIQQQRRENPSKCATVHNPRDVCTGEYIDLVGEGSSEVG